MSGPWPRLVRPELCVSAAAVVLTDGENPDGSPRVAARLERNCRLERDEGRGITPNRDFGDGSRRSADTERLEDQGGATALFDGDLAPQLPMLAGTVTAEGRVWKISRGYRARDPDGRVNYTRLTLE